MNQKEVKLLQQAEAKAVLAQKNKEAARIHLLQIQTYLARTPIRIKNDLSKNI
jgi:hypothetical protein